MLFHGVSSQIITFEYFQQILELSGYIHTQIQTFAFIISSVFCNRERKIFINIFRTVVIIFFCNSIILFSSVIYLFRFYRFFQGSVPKW